MEQLSESTVTLDTRKPNFLSLVAKATGQRVSLCSPGSPGTRSVDWPRT
ncbi:hypothetical protein LEMLEM_LOCUS11236 [Lemmus lemmus]